MSEEEQNPNPMIFYLVPDLLEEIILRLPLKSIRKFRAVSKGWRSIVESKSFAERRMNLRKSRRQILAAGGVERTSESRFEGKGCNIFPALWAMGFGRDKVNGSFKVVRMFFDPHHYCEVLDVNIGEWRRSVRPPPYVVDARRKSACVNGSIYWLGSDLLKLLALDLHTLEFRDVPSTRYSTTFICAEQLVNLDGRLALSTTATSPWRLEILTMDAQKEDGWTLTYSIRLYSCSNLYACPADVHFRPVAVSKQGNLFFHDNKKRLLKFYPSTNLIRCISKDTLVISPFIENWLPLLPPKTTSRISIGPKIPIILLAAHVYCSFPLLFCLL
ncbi:PREDICTED: F-box/LRR-repeat protein At2g43260-like [Camelina sativa]|uniref:F-box/LRR-repeat protein At2g43260-like n=1 Tax=Camelina sativa TaxID=90675 RepID=A0ABM0YUQ1_CAMSA|nr:PREDICTED: F-box/LRR-repeat protein At2g43260-like [Camelina sativa]